MYYGISTGETGQCGVGDLVEGESWSKDSDGTYIVSGEPCHSVITIINGKIEYAD